MLSREAPKGALTIPGLFLVTGGIGTGKSSFALECGAADDRICFVDDDLKGLSTARQLKVSGREFAYYDLVEKNRGCKSLVEIHQVGLDLINSIPKGRFDALVWDTWTRFGSTFKPFVEAHPEQFRKKAEWLSLIHI